MPTLSNTNIKSILKPGNRVEIIKDTCGHNIPIGKIITFKNFYYEEGECNNCGSDIYNGQCNCGEVQNRYIPRGIEIKESSCYVTIKDFKLIDNYTKGFWA